MAERGEGALWSLFHEGTNLIREGSTLMTYLLPRDLPPNTITLEIRSSTYEFWGNTDVQTTALTSASFGSVDTIYSSKNSPDSSRVIYHFDKGSMLHLICSLIFSKKKKIMFW